MREIIPSNVSHLEMCRQRRQVPGLFDVLAKRRNNERNAEQNSWDVTNESQNIISFTPKRDLLSIFVPFSIVVVFTPYVLFNSMAPAFFFFTLVKF